MRRVSGFTLVELLVVIAIMIIIMGFSVPMFSKISFGNAVDGASRMISSQLSLARAEAVAKRQYIAIVMPGKDFVQPEDGKTTDEYHFRSFRAAIVEKDDAAETTFNFKEWFPGTEWGFLPKGAVLAEADEDAESEDNTLGVECVYGSDGFDKNTGKITKRNVNVGKPGNQSVSWLGSDNKLEGDNNCSVVNDNGSAKMVEGKNNTNVRAVVFKPNGRVAGGTKFVTIVEGVVQESGSDEYRLTNGNTLNMRLMRVGRLTGKVTYLEPEFE